MKKSQMEMMGIAIIVVLLAFGLLFVIRFVLKEDRPETKESFIESKLASSVMDTLLKTTATECRGFSLGELIKDCRESIGGGPPVWTGDYVRDNSIEQAGGIACYGGAPDSCDVSLSKINDILNSTLGGQLRVDYEFFILSETKGEPCRKVNYPPNIIFTAGSKCPGTKKHVCQPWPTSIDTIQLGLDICSKA